MLPDQNEAERWAPDGGSAQISVFFSPDAQITQDNLKELAYSIQEGLAEDSIAREEGARGRDCMDAYSTTGALSLERDRVQMEVDAVGIGGDFFAFHPLEMVSGDYFSGDDLMKDKILLDEETAWKLFGSPDIAGQTVLIGDMPHTVMGVYHRENGSFYEKAGLDRATVFVSYKTVLQYGIEKTFSGTESSDEEIGTNNIADTSGLSDFFARRSGGSADAGPMALLERGRQLLSGQTQETGETAPVNPSTATDGSGDVPQITSARADALLDLMRECLSPSEDEGLRRAIDSQQRQIGDLIAARRQLLDGAPDAASARPHDYPIQLEREMLGRVRLGDKKGARAMLNELLAHIFLRSPGNLELIKARLLELVVMISRATSWAR